MFLTLSTYRPVYIPERTPWILPKVVAKREGITLKGLAWIPGATSDTAGWSSMRTATCAGLKWDSRSRPRTWPPALSYVTKQACVAFSVFVLDQAECSAWV